MKRKLLFIQVLLSLVPLLNGQNYYHDSFITILDKVYPKSKSYPEFNGIFYREQYYTKDSALNEFICLTSGDLTCEMEIDSSIIKSTLNRKYSYFNLVESFPVELLYYLKDSIVSFQTMQYYLPVIDTIISKMDNLTFLKIWGKNNKKTQISKWNSPLFFLYLDGCELPSNIDVNQFDRTLKILMIEARKVKKNCILDFSNLKQLEYFSFQNGSRTSQYSIIFPPNVKYLRYYVDYNRNAIQFPESTEMLFLEIENKKYNVKSFNNLTKLKFLSIEPSYKYFYKNDYIPLPKEVTQLKSLQTLRIYYLTDENIDIISQISHLKNLQIIDQKEIPLNIYKLVNIENIEFPYGTSESIIQSFRKVLPNVKITLFRYY